MQRVRELETQKTVEILDEIQELHQYEVLVEFRGMWKKGHTTLFAGSGHSMCTGCVGTQPAAHGSSRTGWRCLREVPCGINPEKLDCIGLNP